MSGNRLVLASKNPGKIRELQALMAGSGIEVIGLDPAAPDVDETGTTFEENALLKARAACAATGLPALGEDSGLAVDALGGEPGIHSARWVPGSDADRMYALVERMEAVPDGERSGRYVSTIALVMPDGREQVVRGELEGTIGREPRGMGGFGYDPIFVLSTGRTTAEITMEEKNAISHRGRALAKAMAILPELLGS
ncbi:MAG TPA: RdgB/HAM1 family non-canonical purine NTP pyrophosphatase [Symbiobacteriaceae bacterium]|nr:RdgB/HAM1 family non-canonical purine NTP pyrophosphatase [Symbiobacteriaceae bacterium]